MRHNSYCTLLPLRRHPHHRNQMIRKEGVHPCCHSFLRLHILKARVGMMLGSMSVFARLIGVSLSGIERLALVESEVLLS